METNWAEEHLQTIRTLMERSALYRRALAPIMIFCGVAGITGGIIGWKLSLNSIHEFILFWMVVAALGLLGSMLLIRRQALKDSEPFWSAPTKRIVQALTAPYTVAIVISLAMTRSNNDESNFGAAILVLVWTFAYGCAAHTAGFFVKRGIKLFAWLFIATGVVLTGCLSYHIEDTLSISFHLLMGGIFGGLHLAYGVYLYLTENRKNAA
jgi:FtsH-binding integral membrane protein